MAIEARFFEKRNEIERPTAIAKRRVTTVHTLRNWNINARSVWIIMQPTKCFDFTTNRRVLSILYDACSSSCGRVCVCNVFAAQTMYYVCRCQMEKRRNKKCPETQRYTEDVCSSLLNRGECEIHVQIKLKKCEKMEKRMRYRMQTHITHTSARIQFTEVNASERREENFSERISSTMPNLLHSYYFHLNTVHIFHWFFPSSVSWTTSCEHSYVNASQTHLMPITVTTTTIDAYM